MKRDKDGDIDLESIEPDRCILPCRYMEKRYIVAHCDEEQGIVDVDTIQSRHSIWTYTANAEYPRECNLTADIVVPDEDEKEAKTYVESNPACHIMDVHHHPEDDPNLMPGSHLHILCEQIDSSELRGLVDRLLDRLT